MRQCPNSVPNRDRPNENDPFPHARARHDVGARRAPARAEAAGAGRLVPARLHRIGLLLHAVARRCGRRRQAEQRHLPVGMDCERKLLLAHRQALTWDPEDKERTALHEAGHAVVAWSFGITVGCIHLDIEKEGGHAQIASTAHLEHFEQIANWLAGFGAEQVFKPPGRKANAMIDCGEVRRLLRENGTSDDEAEGREIHERGRTCTEDRLRKHATKVRRVADHLIEYHYMDRVLFEAMMQEPQEPARVLYFLFTPPRVALSTSHSRFVAAMQRAIERGLECKPEGEGTERAA